MIKSAEIPAVSEETARRVLYGVNNALTSSPYQEGGALLFGGIDSILLAALDGRTKAVTVGIQDYNTDLGVAEFAAAELGLNWHFIEIRPRKALEVAVEVVRLTGSYDETFVVCGVPRLIAAQFATKYLYAKFLRTGDIGDENFGYPFQYKDSQEKVVNDLNTHLEYNKSVILDITTPLGINIDLPYASPSVREVSATLAKEDNVLELATSIPGDSFEKWQIQTGQIPSATTYEWGKIALRGAARLIGLSETIVGLPKAYINHGFGQDGLIKILEATLTDKEASEWEEEHKRLKEENKEYTQRFYSKAHLALYKIHQELGYAA